MNSITFVHVHDETMIKILVYVHVHDGTMMKVIVSVYVHDETKIKIICSMIHDYLLKSLFMSMTGQ